MPSDALMTVRSALIGAALLTAGLGSANVAANPECSDPANVGTVIGGVPEISGGSGSEVATQIVMHMESNGVFLGTGNQGAIDRETCDGMLVVDRQMLDQAIDRGENGDGVYGIDHQGFTYTLGDSDFNVYTGQVSDFSDLFSSASGFNESIDYWDVSNVTTMESLFAGANSFNQKIDGWDVENVTTMENLFASATSFNQSLGDWDVSSVTNMAGLFDGAASFNQDISDWDVENVTTMESLFAGASNFNQDIGDWEVGSVTNMTGLFDGAASFNQDIGGWEVGSVTNMASLFDGASSFNQDIGDWDVASSNSFSAIFKDAGNFDQDISGWNVFEAESTTGAPAFEQMFLNTASFNQSLADWCFEIIAETPSQFSDGTSSWTESQPTFGGCFPSATGGSVTEITQDGNTYRVHTFSSSGTLDFESGGDIEYLVEAGGGAGGSLYNAGGASSGSGGEAQTNATTVDEGEYSVSVGSGGSSRSACSSGCPARRGSDSSLTGSGLSVVSSGGRGGTGYTCYQDSPSTCNWSSVSGESGYSGSSITSDINGSSQTYGNNGGSGASGWTYGYRSGSSGGSGIVIVRYQIAD